MKAVIMSAAVITLCGCVAPRPLVPISAFDVGQARGMMEKGTNTIRGSALIRQVGGGVVTCAGREVELIPATAYATEVVRGIYGSDTGGYNPEFGRVSVALNNVPPEFRKLRTQSRCDAQGYFKFDHVSDGTFYVQTAITWMVTRYVSDGGVLVSRITVTGGETKEIVLAP